MEKQTTQRLKRNIAPSSAAGATTISLTSIIPVLKMWCLLVSQYVFVVFVILGVTREI
tara:strand:+ start:1911 stop:2084 length:174 start_codon:yes stop_codon:yes gene_type:complete